jgi:hypothetical protein
VKEVKKESRERVLKGPIENTISLNHPLPKKALDTDPDRVLYRNPF